jgi:hypothetical protein
MLAGNDAAQTAKQAGGSFQEPNMSNSDGARWAWAASKAAQPGLASAGGGQASTNIENPSIINRLHQLGAPRYPRSSFWLPDKLSSPALADS